MKKLTVAGFSLLAALSTAVPAAAADTVYVQITGASQGNFSGDSANGGRVVVLHLDLSGTAPTDSTSGQPAGKRRWNPVRFTKALDKTSAQFFRALATGEHLSSVTFTVYGARNADGTSPGSAATALYTVKLGDAYITADEIVAPSDKDPATGAGYAEAVENVTLTFQRITVIYTGGASASDTWN